MATDYHVSGVAQISVGTGSAGALEVLGHSIDGVEIDPTIVEIPIYTDASGGPEGVPATFQRLGEFHTISSNVLVYDKAVMVKVRQGMVLLKAGKVEGVMGKAGTILDAAAIGSAGNGGLYRLLIASPDDAEPRNYLYAKLVKKPRKMNTLATVYRLTWQAIPYIGPANTMDNAVLFNTTTS